MVHFQFTLSVYHNIGILFPVEQPLDDFQGLSNFHGHNSWFSCEVALMYSGLIQTLILCNILYLSSACQG